MLGSFARNEHCTNFASENVFRFLQQRCNILLVKLLYVTELLDKIYRRKAARSKTGVVHVLVRSFMSANFLASLVRCSSRAESIEWLRWVESRLLLRSLRNPSHVCQTHSHTKVSQSVKQQEQRFVEWRHKNHFTIHHDTKKQPEPIIQYQNLHASFISALYFPQIS